MTSETLNSQSAAIAASVTLNDTTRLMLAKPQLFEVVAAPTTLAKESSVSAQLAKADVSVPLEKPMLLNKVDHIRWMNPQLAEAIAEIRPLAPGQPRSQMTVPICLSDHLSDTVLYEDPQNPNQKFYLPRYRLEEANNQAQIFLRSSGTGWSLTLKLQRYPAILSTGASELSHAVTVILRHTLKLGSTDAGYREWVFPELSNYAGGVQAVLPINATLERDLLYQVLTNPAYGATLIVRRAIKVAIPYQPEMAITQFIDPIVSSGQATIRGTWTFNLDKGVEGDAVSDIWWNQKTRSDRAMVPQGQAKICYLGAADFDGLTGKALESLQYTTNEIASTERRISKPVEAIKPGKIRPIGIKPRPTPIFDALKVQPMRPPIGVGEPIYPDGPPIFIEPQIYIEGLKQGDVFAVLTNGGTYAKVQVINYGYDIVIRWVTYRPSPKEPLYREVSRALDDSSDRAPFVFPPDLYRYVFSGITASSQTFQPIRRQVMWQAPNDLQPRLRNYFQDPVTPYLFYYLPDAFKIVRRSQSPHHPILALTVQSADGSPETTQVTMDYAAVPVINPDRLTAAATELQKYISGPLPTAVSGPVFQALATDQTRLSVQIPTAGGGVLDQVRSQVRVSLDDGFKDSITLPLNQFHTVFNAVFGESSLLMQGYVVIDFTEIPDEQVPFIAQMDDLAGDIFDYRAEPNPSGGLQVTLTNAIESPVKLNHLGAKLHRGGAKVSGLLSGVTFPLDLAPGASVSFGVMPTEALSGPNPVQALFDLSGVQVLPNRRTILDSILKSYQRPEYERAITVEAFREQFDPNAPDPLQAIVVEFQPGYQSVQLRADALKATGLVRWPIKDVLVGDAQSGEYQYRVITVRQNSRQTREWQTETSASLFPDV